MVKKEKIVTEIHLRIKSKKTALLLQQAIDQDKSNRKGIKNEIINAALDLGLPAYLEDMDPKGAISGMLDKFTTDIMSYFKKENDKTRLEIIKILTFQFVSESMLSALYQEFNYFLTTQNTDIPDNLRSEFANKLPEIFENIKQETLKKVLELKFGQDESN